MKKQLLTSIIILIAFSSSWAQNIQNKIDSLIAKAVEINRFNGSILVSKNGKIVYEKAYGFQDAVKKILNTERTIYQIGSTTKEFTAAVILKLAEQNKLTLNDKLSKYFPDFNRGNEITIRHLLTHSSGIYEILRDHTAVEESTKPRTKERMLSFFKDKLLEFTPGTAYAYCNSGYMLLGLIIEKVTRESYEQVVRKLIFEPLKMTHSGFDFAGLKNSSKATGYAKYTKYKKESIIPWDSTATYSAGSMYSTIEDLYKWHQGLEKYKVYNKASMELATTPYLKGYGLGCWIDTLFSKKVVSHGGNILGFTSYFGRIQEDNVSIIILNNIYNHQIETIGQSILAILYQKPYSYFDIIGLNQDQTIAYTGNYDINPRYQVSITSEEGKLFIQRNKSEKIEIFSYGSDIFFQKDDDIRISFQRKDSIVKRITIIEGLSTRKGDKIN